VVWSGRSDIIVRRRESPSLLNLEEAMIVGVGYPTTHLG